MGNATPMKTDIFMTIPTKVHVALQKSCNKFAAPSEMIPNSLSMSPRNISSELNVHPTASAKVTSADVCQVKADKEDAQRALMTTKSSPSWQTSWPVTTTWNSTAQCKSS